MATPGTNARVIVGGYDLSAFFRNLKATAGAKTVPTETFGSSDEKPFATLKNGVLTLDGNFEGAVGEVDARMAAALGVNDGIVTVAFGNTLGDVGRGLQACGNAYDVNAAVDGIASVSAAFASKVGLERVLVAHPLGAETVAGNGGVIDNLASSANGLRAYLQVTAFVGTDCTVKLQDSANNSTYADIITFAQITAARASERKFLAGTIRQYVRWAISGTFTSITFHLAHGRG